MSNKREANSRNNKTYAAGTVLIGAGILMLLANMGILGGIGGIAGLLILGGMGAWLIHEYFNRRRQEWLLIAGFILLGAGAATVTGGLAGAWFLGLAATGFLYVWRENARHWWALIPAGVMYTLTAVVLSDVYRPMQWLDGGVVFFAGIAATFLSLYLLPRHNQTWALIPAAGSAALALVVLGATGSWFVPVLLIGVGLLLIRGDNRMPSFTVNWPSDSTKTRDAAPQTDKEPELLPPTSQGSGPDVPGDWERKD